MENQEQVNHVGNIVLPKNITEKKVLVTCEGAELMDIDEMTIFQGDLKEISEENFSKLVRSIIEFGYSFPQYIWKDGDGLNNILGGTHRYKALKYLRDNGWEVPKVPINWVHAKDRIEAKKKLLMEISQFADTTQEGLHEFSHDIPEMKDMLSSFKIPDFDMGNFAGSFYADPEPPKEGTEKSKGKDLIECPKCGEVIEK